jgi:hypothetical protein
MLIRDEQMEELRKAPLRAFEDEMVAHLAEFSPPLFKAVKENQMRVVICLGIARAGKYGITFRGPIRFYLELMLLFGSHFDTDPQYPWAAEILRDSAPQMSRAERLYERTLDYRKNVGGPKDAHTLQALRNIRVLVDQPLTVSSDNFSSAILEAMTRVYPQKMAYVGENGLRVLIDAGIVAAQKYGFSSIRALALPVVLMFAFGHNCFHDPLYPWIERTLEEETITDPEARARRLEKKAVIWLDHVLGYFDKAART